MFGRNVGLAAVCGPVSQDLEVLDFESGAPFDDWVRLVQNSCSGSLLNSLVVVATPSGGHHVVPGEFLIKQPSACERDHCSSLSMQMTSSWRNCR
jgi:hypothetical protein